MAIFVLWGTRMQCFNDGRQIGEDVSFAAFLRRFPEAKSKAAERYIYATSFATKELPAHRVGRYSDVFFVSVCQTSMC